MGILLQSVTIQIRRRFWHISYYKVQQSNFIKNCDRLLLQGASGITKRDRLLLQSASGITKCDRLYYKVRQVLQSATVITKWDVKLVVMQLQKIFLRVTETSLKLNSSQKLQTETTTDSFTISVTVIHSKGILKLY